jgi:hypothetical protein
MKNDGRPPFSGLLGVFQIAHYLGRNEKGGAHRQSTARQHCILTGTEIGPRGRICLSADCSFGSRLEELCRPWHSRQPLWPRWHTGGARRGAL